MSSQNYQNPNRELFQVGIALKNIHDEVLLIKEPGASASHPGGAAETTTVPSDAVKGGKWRLPCDCLRDEDDLPVSLSGAASVIGTKLTGYDFDEHGICYIGLREWPSVAVIYAADQPYSVDQTDPPDPEKVATVGWFTYDYILKLNEDGLLRDPEMTLAAVKNVQKGLTIPPELITI